MRYRLRTTAITGGLAALLLVSLGGCAAHHRCQKAAACGRADAAAQKAESAATKAEDAAQRVEDAARRAEEAAQKAEAIFSKQLRK